MDYSSGCDKPDNPINESPKVWTELKSNVSQVSESGEQQTIQSMATDNNGETEGAANQSPQRMTFGGQQLPPMICLESGDGSDYSMSGVLQTDSIRRQYCPSSESRQLHNHKERLRRSRMKCSCDALRALVPGLTDKTDKATVLEHTVAFLFHLSKCAGVKCNDYLPTYPPPMSAKLLDLYPTLMSGEYQYYETIPSMETEFTSAVNESDIIEVRESNGTQFVITSDGSQYMVVTKETEPTDGDQLMPTAEEQPIDDSVQQLMNTCIESTEQMSVEPVPPKDEPMEPTPEESPKCVVQVVGLLTDNKENIDPNAVIEEKPIRKKRAYRKRFKKGDDISSNVTTDESNTVPKVLKQRKLRNKSQIN